MPAMQHTIKCPTCKGKAVVPLKPHLQETMDSVERVLKKHPTGATATLVHEDLKSDKTVSSINLRLEELVADGVLIRLTDKNRVHYFPKEPKPKQSKS